MRTSTVFVLLGLLAIACAGPATAPTWSPDASPSAAPTATVRPTSTPTSSATPASGFYLRAWFEQAAPPQTTFGQLPILTINEGVVIDGNIAIPAIYPGPILVTPFARSITADGQTMIVEEARRLGLVDDETDFTGGGVAPGEQIARLLMVIDGVTYDLSGLLDHFHGCGQRSCDEPGSAEAFVTFWQELSMLVSWVGGELGFTEAYVPETVAVLLTAPTRGEPGLQQQLVTWPLEGSFGQMGVEFPGVPGARCLTITGDDVAVVVPVLEQANQLSVFHDEVDGQASASAVVVVPGADSPCDH